MRADNLFPHTVLCVENLLLGVPVCVLLRSVD